MELIEETGIPDFSAIVDLLRDELKGFPEAGTWTDEEVIRFQNGHYNRESDFIKILREGEKTIGYYRCSRWPREDAETATAHLLDIALSSPYRGKGLASMMMKDLFGECSRRGYHTILSRTLDTNTASIKLHRKNGFAESFRKDNSIVWEKKL